MGLMLQPSPTPEGDQPIGACVTDEFGECIFENLPPGDYVFYIDGERVEVTITEDQDRVILPGISGDTPDTIGEGTDTGGEFPPAPTSEGVGPTSTALPDAGLFDGSGGDVTSTDLLILGLAGMALMGVVFAARRMRTTL
jgi:hypothetical protein